MLTRLQGRARKTRNILQSGVCAVSGLRARRLLRQSRKAPSRRRRQMRGTATSSPMAKPGSAGLGWVVVGTGFSVGIVREVLDECVVVGKKVVSDVVVVAGHWLPRLGGS